MSTVRKLMLGATALSLAMAGATAFAAQNVANTSQKGSLLIFPKIDVSGAKNTIIRITNDHYRDVAVKCYWKNGSKYKLDFQFVLTRKQPFWFEARDGRGTHQVNPFPAGMQGPFEGDTNAGELKCWAVHKSGAKGISWNHLQGAATIFDPVRGTAYEYNSWNFAARGVKLGGKVGDPGTIVLGGLSGDYDACPRYLVGQFTPYRSPGGLGVEVRDTDLAVASCTQDLREEFDFTYTRLMFTVWNEHEVKYTGAYHCIDSWHELYLRDGDGGVAVGGENFTYDSLGTRFARFRVKGVASNKCPQYTERTQAVGLVGLTAAEIAFFEDVGDDDIELAVAGTTLNGAGHQPGLILWDPEEKDVPER